MSLKVILKYLDREREPNESAEDLRDRLSDVISEIGFDFFTLVRQPGPESEPSEVMLAGQWPKDWPELYVKRKYASIDPMVRFLGHSQTGFRWREAAETFEDGPGQNRIRRLFKEARRYGLEDGYVFPVHGRRGLVGVLSVAGKETDLSPSEMALMDALAKRAFWELLEVIDYESFGRLSKPVTLQMTNRERETLEHLGYGMTSSEMGETLGLSAHTVDWYMSGVQNKLRAKNRHHAVAIAFRLGLIS